MTDYDYNYDYEKQLKLGLNDEETMWWRMLS